MNADEQKGYRKGYVAGRRKLKDDHSRELERKERQAFMDKLYLELLPVAMTVENWTIGKKQCTDRDSRVELARLWALEAFKQRPIVRGMQ